MCPFCYLGKRKFEKALEAFPEREKIQLERKSFELMPDLRPGQAVDLQEMLVETKGMAMEQVKAMNAQLAEAGKQIGIDFNFENALGTNTRYAHRLIQLAKAHGKGDRAEELLFKAFFTQGRHIGDIPTLIGLGAEMGLDPGEVRTVLESDAYGGEVERDIQEARQVGVRGVPFFVLDGKYAISGAQEPDIFLGALEKSFGEWQERNPQPTFEILEGKSCSPEGHCE